MATDLEGLRRGTHDWTSPEYIDKWLKSAAERDTQRGLHFWLMAQVLPFGQNDTFRVADIGCGGGAAAQVVLEAFPKSQAVCVDGSEAMLAKAKENLGSFGDRVSYVQADFSKAGWAQPLSGSGLDAAVSSKAIHNLFDAGAVRGVYDGVASMLRTGGVFVNIDNVSAIEPLLDRFDATHRARKDQREGNAPLTSVLYAGVSRQRSGERFAGTLEEHFQWLRKAGFTAADAIWREVYTAVIVAVR